MSEIVFPTEPIEITRTMPRTIIAMSKEKIGKSTVAARLTTEFAPSIKKKAMILSLGETGYENQKAVFLQCPKASVFNKALAKLSNMEKKYDFVLIDHITKMDEWSELVGTINYMKSIQGKSFNLKARIDNPNAKGIGFNKNTANQYFLPGDENFKSVTSLPDGAGYRWSRAVMMNWLDIIETCAEHIILFGHIKIDRHSKNDNGQITNSAFLNATGAVSTLYTQRVDCLSTMFRKGKEGFLSFKRGAADYQAGSRYNYLEGERIKISEKNEDGTITTFWENIYPDY